MKNIFKLPFENKVYGALFSLALVAIALPVGVLLLQSPQTLLGRAAAATELSLATTTPTPTTGQRINVNVQTNTRGNAVNKIELEITYDKTKLRGAAVTAPNPPPVSGNPSFYNFVQSSLDLGVTTGVLKVTLTKPDGAPSVNSDLLTSAVVSFDVIATGSSSLTLGTTKVYADNETGDVVVSRGNPLSLTASETSFSLSEARYDAYLATLQPAQPYQIGETFPVSVLVRSDSFEANRFKLDISYNPQLFEVVSLQPDTSVIAPTPTPSPTPTATISPSVTVTPTVPPSPTVTPSPSPTPTGTQGGPWVINTWTKKEFSNATGTINLEGSTTTPFKSDPNDVTTKYVIATITFKAKAVGSEEIKIASPAYIYRSSDDVNVLNFARNATVSVVPPFTIAGTVFLDINENTLKNLGETGLNGWDVDLKAKDAAGTFVVSTSTKTDASGGFSFGSLPSGDYQVTSKQPLPNGFKTTMPAADIPVTLSAQSSSAFVVIGMTKSDGSAFYPGDINRDGGVDIADYNLLLPAFGQTNPADSRVDINSDTRVDVLDYSHFYENFGASKSASASATCNPADNTEVYACMKTNVKVCRDYADSCRVPADWTPVNQMVCAQDPECPTSYKCVAGACIKQ